MFNREVRDSGSIQKVPYAGSSPQKEQIARGEIEEKTRAVSADAISSNEKDHSVKSSSLKERVREKNIIPVKNFNKLLFSLSCALEGDKERLREVINGLDFQNLNDQSEIQVIEFTALLFRAKFENNGVMFDEKFVISKLPDFAKQYYEVLSNFMRGDGSELYEEIKKITNPNDQTLFYAKMANALSASSLSFGEFKDLKGWDSLNLAFLAPHLRNFLITPDMDTDSIEQLLQFSTNIYSLEVMDSNTHVLKNIKLPPLPNCHTFKINDFSCTIPQLPNCRIFKSEDCENLGTIPSDLQNCQSFTCTNCPRVTSFPALPNCIQFSCKDCKNLKTLPSDLQECQSFTCTNCPCVISSPAQLPNCIQFSINNCKNLETLLSDLQKCQNFNCSYCPCLISSPRSLPSCIDFNCSNCPKLASMPHVEYAQNVNCSNCPDLYIYPESLPACLNLNCEGSPLVYALPFLTANATVDGSRPLNQPKIEMRVDVGDLQKNPKKYLDELGKNILLLKSFPHVKYQGSQGLDIGGLRRDFVSRIFELVFAEVKEADGSHLESFKPTREGLDPIAREADQLSYISIGRNFALCYLGDSDVTIGTIFRPSLFKNLLDLIQSSSDDTFVAIFLDFMMGEEESQQQKGVRAKITADLDPQEGLEEDLLAAYAACELAELDAEIEQLTCENYKNRIWPMVIKKAKGHGYMRALSWIGRGIRETLDETSWNELDKKDPVSLQNRIQGKLSAELLKEKIGYSRENILILNEHLEQIKTYVNTWIDKQDLDQLSLFLKGITGSTTLGRQGIDIRVVSTESHLPIAHTCFFRVDISFKFKDQDDFDRVMQLFLNHFGNGSGFQFF